MPYLAFRNASEKWTIPIRNWEEALSQSAIEFGKEQVPFLCQIPIAKKTRHLEKEYFDG
jgi:hypothetical protein